MLSCLLAAFYQFALFFFYFFYFLFKGKPEWQKIGSVERCTTNNCCLHNPKVQTDSSSSATSNSKLAEHIETMDKNTDIIKTEVSWREKKQSIATTSKFQMFQRMNSYQQLGEQYANKAARIFQNLCSAFYSILEGISTIIVHFIVWLYSIIHEWLVSSGNSTTISGTPTGSIHNQKQMQNAFVETTNENVQVELRQRNKQQEIQQQQQQQQSFSTVVNPPPQPLQLPPPPPTTSSLSLSLPAFKTVTSATSTKDNEKVPPKGGVAVLPLDIMAEAHARVKERELKLSEQKVEPQENNEMNGDWTVTSKRFIPLKWKAPTSKVEEGLTVENKANKNDETLKPARRNIVSRISRSSDQDAQFIFRAPTHQNISSNRLPDGNFLMGRSVFSPVREAEEMRDRVNRRMTETPSESFFGYPASRSRSQSRIHTIFSPPLTTNQIHSPRRDESGINMLRQRSRTVEPRLAEGTVKALTRQWPPQSNATGVFVAKDNWNIIPVEIVSCRRVMERSVTDKWTTRDEKGDIMDERLIRSWKGETDGLRRCYDGTGETWHRKIEVSPEGTASFVNNRRFYTKDYVIESETRNA
ncbi:putative integral membrane protein [Acanthocheilonema viteae]